MKKMFDIIVLIGVFVFEIIRLFSGNDSNADMIQIIDNNPEEDRQKKIFFYFGLVMIIFIPIFLWWLISSFITFTNNNIN